MKKTIFFQILLLAALSACRNDPPAGKETTSSSGNLSANAVDLASIKFLCQSAAEPNTDADAPRHEVYLQIGTTKVKVADILNCEILTKDAYEQNQIPANAIAAVGGWWAGAGDYLYVIEEGGNYVVKQGAIAEESTNNDFGYKTIMSFDQAGNEVF